MACYYPLKGFPYGSTNQGRTNFIITPYSIDHIEIDDAGRIRRAADRGISANTRLCISGESAIEIPCGQCIGCRLDYSSMWASRCVLEMQNHDDNMFITLTYDDDNLPGHRVKGLISGKEFVSYSLQPEDLQLFWKRLRKNFPDKKIRYYACGEYGDQSCRPHYHAIIFGLGIDDFNDKFIVNQSELGYNYYGSEKLASIWKKGNVLIAEASWESAAYVARYVMKKQKGLGADFYDRVSIVPEYVVMSRRPGIGAEWFDANKKCYATFLRHYISTSNGSRGVGKIRYFDNKLDEEYPFDYEKIKMNRQEFSEYRKRLKAQQTSLNYLDLLQVEKETLSNKTKVFKRISI